MQDFPTEDADLTGVPNPKAAAFRKILCQNEKIGTLGGAVRIRQWSRPEIGI